MSVTPVSHNEIPEWHCYFGCRMFYDCLEQAVIEDLADKIERQ